MLNRPESEPELSSLSPHGLRAFIAAAALAALLTGCKQERMDYHIEIKDPAANIELEKLRREFETATQRTRYGSPREKSERIKEILGKRDQLLEANGIRKKTETWFEDGEGSGGPPFMGIHVDKRACNRAPACIVKSPQDPFPELETD